MDGDLEKEGGGNGWDTCMVYGVCPEEKELIWFDFALAVLFWCGLVGFFSYFSCR